MGFVTAQDMQLKLPLNGPGYQVGISVSRVAIHLQAETRAIEAALRRLCADGYLRRAGRGRFLVTLRGLEAMDSGYQLYAAADLNHLTPRLAAVKRSATVANTQRQAASWFGVRSMDKWRKLRRKAEC